MKPFFYQGIAIGVAIALTVAAYARALPTTLPSSRPSSTPIGKSPAVSGQPKSLSRNAPDVDLTQLSLEDLMNVDVTSVSKSKQRIGDTPAAVTVISQDDIQRSGLREIPEILRLSPGLYVQRGTQFTTWTVASRGLPYDFNNNLLVMQDGRSLYSPIFGGVVWNTVDYPVADLDRIEVVRGPGATLWGANAINGVINIISKSSKDTQGLLVDARAGTDDSDLAVRYGGKIDDNTYFRVYGKGRYFEDLAAAGETDPNFGLESYSGGFRIDRDSSSADLLTLQGDLMDVNGENSLIQPLFVPPYSSMGKPTNVFQTANLLGRWTHTVSDTSEYSLQAYFDYLGINSALQVEQISTYDVDFNHHFQLTPNNAVVYGFGARYQPFESAQPGDGLTPDSPLGITWIPHIDMYSYNVFLQDTFAIIPSRLSLTLGSKYEYNNLSKSEFEPSARLLWTPDAKNSFWAAVSRAARTPGLDNRTFHFPVAVFPNNQGSVTEITFAGNGNNDSEHLLSYELGYRAQLAKAWSVDVSGFLDEHQGLLVAQQIAPITETVPVPHIEMISRDVNGTDTENYGVEISSNYKVNDRWRLAASYSLVASHVVWAAPLTSLAGTYYDGPENQVQFHSYLDLTSTVQFNSSLYYVGAAQDGLINSYTRVDVNLTWMPRPGLSIQLGAQNALDPKHAEFLVRSGGQAEVRRAFYLQTKYEF